MRRWASACGILLFDASIALAAGGDLRLVNAVKQQDPATARALLKQPGIDVNAAQGDGATALHWAAYWNDQDTLALLLAAGAHVNTANDLGVTPLALACSNGNAATVQTLLGAGANPNAAQASGKTALMTAAWIGSADVVQLLLAHGADPNAKEPSRGQTALMWAISEQHRDVARILVEHGAAVRGRSKAGFTPLLFAARMGDLDTVQLLLAAGADVNEAMPNEKKDLSGTRFPAGGGRDNGAAGASPLLVATIRGYVDLAKFLLDHGADVNAAGAGYTTLHWVAGTWDSWMNLAGGKVTRAEETHARFGLEGPAKLDMVKTLLAHGANPNVRMVTPRFNTTDEDGINALGIDTILKTRLDGATPFALAAAAGDVDVMRVLLDAGADPAVGTKEGTTPLMLIAGLGRNPSYTLMTESRAFAAAKWLVEMGADVNAVNDAGNTALHGAAHMRNEPLIQLLVENGARLNAKNADGQTPRMIAERTVQLFGNPVTGEHTGAGDLLRKLGANDQ